MTEGSKSNRFTLALAGVLLAGLAVAFMQPALAQSKPKSGGLNKDWGNCSIIHCDTGR